MAQIHFQTLLFNPGDRPRCIVTNIPGDCGEFWTGWEEGAVPFHNACPLGCSKSCLSDTDSRLVGFPPRPEFSEKGHCEGVTILRSPIDPMMNGIIEQNGVRANS